MSVLRWYTGHNYFESDFERVVYTFPFQTSGYNTTTTDALVGGTAAELITPGVGLLIGDALNPDLVEIAAIIYVITAGNHSRASLSAFQYDAMRQYLSIGSLNLSGCSLDRGVRACIVNNKCGEECKGKNSDSGK